MSKMIGTETIARVEARPGGRSIGYWIVTSLLAASMTISGIGQLMQLEGNLELVAKLEYPVYVLTILGIWKVLGSIALVVPGFPRLKEWAYAGIFFVMTGAAFSHVFAADYGFPLILPLCYAALNMVSWALRPENRKL
ncbi:DoxX family protein [Paenibacillus sp. GCM10023248]|uniref:DoxX family protein n=1 Tax=Bacillales TaxID=1385 RepID=UPI002377DD01|nr:MULTISPECIES: DoxX family protein [Bacillales]MDD9269402.1 DoxX family protein [Paenibacillus sp. MAHUQ-63]MDR6880979.1 putative membrane protein YphA (DoxX/SURF4 family) [Bacillus sp. 3255]